MDTIDDELGSSHKKDMDIRLQTSNNLDLNLEQDCHSPKVSHVIAPQSSFSLKDEAHVEGVLKIGMEFESDERAYKFYNKYAGLVGFSVRKDWVNRSKVHGQVVSRKFTCSKEGYRRKDKRDGSVKKHRRETRTGCLAHMIITRQHDGKYKITQFEAKHNHESVNPSCVGTLQSEMILSVPQITENELTNNSEAQSKSGFELIGKRFEVRETLDYLAIDHGRYLRSGRLRDIKEGEAGRLLHYFQRQHFENPSFFYAIQLDVDDKVSNMFWADDDMIVDYDHFGDVVCLDSTHRKNKDFRPFVQFIGVNHHKQVVIFAAALLYDETVESLKWLIQTFIEAMSGRKPKAIITDQDAAIVEAVASILPETNHRVCVWQMYQNALKHLGHLVKDTDSFAQDLRSCILYHEDEDDFNRAWEAMLEKYCLQKNEWLRWMCREREKWSVVYGRNTFFVDMKSTHLAESLSNSFKDHLNTDLDVLHFFKHFERVLDELRCKEKEATYDMCRCMPRLMGNVVLLKHASDFYTPKAFEVFQREYEKCLNVLVNQCSEHGSLFEYKANTFGQSREYNVTFNSADDTVICSCMKFEYVGILCSHALKVLDHRNIKVVPSQYILKRWTKGARVDSVRDDSKRTIPENSKLASASRYKDLCHSILKISARAAESEETFQFASRQLDEVMQGVERMLTVKPTEAQAITSSSTGAYACESEHAENILDSNAIESLADNNREKGTKEQEIVLSDQGQLRTFKEEFLKTKRVQNVQSPTADVVASISCPPPPAYDSCQTSIPIPVTQNLYNFEANQVVQCMYQPTNLVIDTESSPNVFYSNQHDSPQLIQDSLIHSTYQETVSNNTQLRQGMDLDIENQQSSPFMLYDHRFRESHT